MQEILVALGRRMKELREKQRVSQEAFAERCGLHRTAVGLLERGKSIPRLDTLLIVSEGLGVTVSTLLRGIEHIGKLPSKTMRDGGCCGKENGNTQCGGQQEV